jgi:ribosome-binding factor A
VSPLARIRVSRVGEQIKKELSQIIQQEIKDPRIGFVTVTAVEMSGDLQQAKVFVSILGSQTEKDDSMKALEKAKGFIRSEVGHRIQLRHVPDIHFAVDQSLDHSEQITRLLHDVRDED